MQNQSRQFEKGIKKKKTVHDDGVSKRCRHFW